MHQRFSVLGLICSILVSAENPISLHSKSINTDNDKSTVRMKEIFLNKKFVDFDSTFYNYNRTKDERNNSWINNIKRFVRPLNDRASITYPQKNRFRRHIPRTYYTYNKQDTPGKYTKPIIDLKSENQQDMPHDFYDSGNTGNYYNYQAKSTDGLTNDCNLNTEIESNSKPVTKTLNESLERKRCIQKRLVPRKRQQLEELFSESFEDGKISELRCRDCKLLEQNTNPEDPNKSYNSNNLRLKQNNYDYFINILKQLIDKLDKPKRSKSLSRKDLLVQKSNELVPLKNKTTEKRKNSSEEELILEKTKENRVIDKHSFPENKFANEKWLGNKIKENNDHEYEPVVSDPRSGLVDRNVSISRGDMNSFDSINPKNQKIETYQDISDNLYSLKVTDTQENTEVSTSPIPENTEHFLVTRETPKPLYLISTLKDKLDSTVMDDNNKWKFRTPDYTELFEKQNNFSNHMANNRNQDKKLESTISNFQTTSNIESSDDSTSDIKNKLQTKNSDVILESSVDENFNRSKDNNLEDADSISVEKENNSLENKLDCSCNKKIIKNVLNSTIMKNITEKRTDTYASPKNLNIEIKNRSNKTRKTNGENIQENNTSERVLIKNKTGFNSDLLERKQIPYVSNNNVDVPKLKKLQKTVVDINDNSSQNTRNKGRKIKTNLQNILTENKSSDLKFGDQRKINNNERIYNVDGIKNKRIPLIINTLSQENPRQFVTQLKQDISRKSHTYIENNLGKFNNNNRTTPSKRIPMMNRTSKGSDRTQNKIASQILPHSIPKKSRTNENIRGNNTKMFSKKVVAKLKHDVPMNSKTFTEKNYGRYYDDSVTIDKKLSPKIESMKSIKSKPLSKTMSKQSKIVFDNSDVDVSKNSPRKFVTGSDMSKTVNKNINYKKTPVNFRLGLVKNMDNTQIYTKPKNTLGNIENAPKDQKRININKTPLQLNKSYPIQLIRTPNSSTRLNPTSQKQINAAISKYTFKNSFNDRKIKDSLVSSISNKKIPNEKYDILDESDLTSRNKHTFNDEKSTESVYIKKNGSSPNLKKIKYDANSDISSQAKLPKVSQTEDDYDYEHAPYNHDDLKPIIFNESKEKKTKLSNRNSGSFVQHPSRQPSFGNQLKNTTGLNPLQSVPMIRPEYDDDPEKWKNNEGEEINTETQQYIPELNLSSYGSIEDISDSIMYDVKDVDRNYLNQSGFEILPQLKVDNGVFKIPLLGHTDFDSNNGSEYISDILIPIEKSNGLHAAISLTKLLTGDFRLLNRDDLAVDLATDMNSPLSASQTSNDGSKFDNTGKPCDQITLKTFHANEEGGKPMVPIHVIQIINNGMCSNNGTETEKKRDRINNLRNLRNEGKRVSSIRPLNPSNNLRKMNQKLENAYNHFDSEILDRFLQVYTPHTV